MPGNSNFTCIVATNSPNNLITVASPYLWETFQDPQKVPETGGSTKPYMYYVFSV